LRLLERYYLKIVPKGQVTFDKIGLQIEEIQSEFLRYDDMISSIYSWDRRKTIMHQSSGATYTMVISLKDKSKRTLCIKVRPIIEFRGVYKDFSRTMEALRQSNYILYKLISFDPNSKIK
jgi:hypothetical protein